MFPLIGALLVNPRSHVPNEPAFFARVTVVAESGTGSLATRLALRSGTQLDKIHNNVHASDRLGRGLTCRTASPSRYGSAAARESR